MPSDHTILKVLVGSHAHGLAGPDSDKDFRSVFAMPTVELFQLRFTYQNTKMMTEAGEISWLATIAPAKLSPAGAVERRSASTTGPLHTPCGSTSHG